MEGANVARTLTVDIFLSVDGWACGDGLPGYFGYLGPELAEWITAELAAPQLVVMGRRTYDSPGGIPGRVRDDRAGQGRVLQDLAQAAWPNTRICGADLVDEIRRMKADSGVPLRTMGSVSLARQLIGQAWWISSA